MFDMKFYIIENNSKNLNIIKRKGINLGNEYIKFDPKAKYLYIAVPFHKVRNKPSVLTTSDYGGPNVTFLGNNINRFLHLFNNFLESYNFEISNINQFIRILKD